MSITVEQLPEIVLNLQSRIVDVLGKQPYIGLSISVTLDAKPWSASFYEDSNMSVRHGWRAETVDQLVDKITASLDEWPTIEEANLRDFQRDLAKLIDKGHETGIAPEFVNPLRPVAKALTDNLLTYREASA